MRNSAYLAEQSHVTVSVCVVLFHGNVFRLYESTSLCSILRGCQYHSVMFAFTAQATCFVEAFVLDAVPVTMPSKRTVMCITLAVFVVLILVLGLGVGLGVKSKHSGDSDEVSTLPSTPSSSTTGSNTGSKTGSSGSGGGSIHRA